jgi:hypothetical protein
VPNDQLTALGKENEDKQYNDELTALGTEYEDKQYNDERTALGTEDDAVSWSLYCLS